MHVLLHVSIVILQFFKFVCVCCSDELAVHVENLALWVHKEFSVVSLDLYTAHDHVVLHVDGDLLVSLGRLLHLTWSGHMWLLKLLVLHVRIGIFKLVIHLTRRVVILDVHFSLLSIDGYSVVGSSFRRRTLALSFQIWTSS